MTTDVFAEGVRVLRLVDEPTNSDPAERRSTRMLTADEQLGIRTFSYIRTPPRQGSRRGRHSHPFDQFYYIVEGTLTLEIGEDSLDAPPGSLLVIPAGVKHRNINNTDHDVVQIMIESRER